MLRVIVRQARPGMILARSILNPRLPEQVLLNAGYKLDTRTISRLHELGVYDFWVHFAGLEFLDNLFSTQLTVQQQRLCETMKESLQQQAQYADAALPVHYYRSVIEDLIHSILDSSPGMPYMSMLAGLEDGLLRHSAEVCVLGLMLGLKLDGYLVEQRRRHLNSRYAKDVVSLGLGCLLHDVGELQLPEKHRESRRPILQDNLDGDRTWQRHTELAYTALRGQIEPSAATVLLNHHQHFDGTGFPAASGNADDAAGLLGTDIHVFARIALAADTYQHLVYAHGVPQPAVCVLWHLQNATMRAWFDPVVLNALLAVVTPFTPGMLVTLSDGQHAVVTKTSVASPCYPEVELLQSANLMGAANQKDRREQIDLAQEPRLHIQSVDGYAVAKYLYGQRQGGTVTATPSLTPASSGSTI